MPASEPSPGRLLPPSRLPTSRGPASGPPSSPDRSPVPDLRRRWRYYRTDHGHDPVRAYLESLPFPDRAAVKARMRVVRDEPRAARHLAGDLYEVRAAREGRAFRVVFVREGRAKQVLLAVAGFTKTTSRTPPQVLDVAHARARAWRERAGIERGGPARHIERSR